MKKFVMIRHRFAGLHCWPDCPYENLSFLRYPHRHLFYITVGLEVTDSDREIEFLKAKSKLEIYLDDYKDTKNQSICWDLGSKSCEMLGEEIGNYMNLIYLNQVSFVEVWEDNENGARIEFTESQAQTGNVLVERWSGWLRGK